MTSTSKSLSSCLVAVFLASCGGGGGGGSSPPPPIPVTASAGTGGQISPSTASVTSGASTAFTLTPNDGYEVDTVSGCGGALSGSTYTTGSITAACTVSATFKLKKYTVLTAAVANGSVSPISAQVTHGTTTAFTLNPNDGYEVDTVSGCGGALSGSTYTTGSITAACTVSATFKKRKVTVKFSAVGYGKMPVTEQTVDWGSNVTVTAQPYRREYIVKSVTGCNATIQNLSVSISSVTSSCEAVVTFGLRFGIISSGNQHTLLLKPDGTLWAWGANEYGQLGDGTAIDRLAPVRIGSGFIDISAGYWGTIAIKSDFTLWGWGLDPGDGSERKLVPTQINAQRKWVLIEAGGPAWALSSDGDAFSWRKNDGGELCIGSTARTLVPTPIAGKWVFIGTGDAATYLINDKAETFACGNNSEAGRLGDGTTESRSTPTKIAGTFQKVFGGGSTAFALGVNGQLFGWGNRQLTPLSFGSGFSGFVDISSGNGHHLALRDDKSVWAWGNTVAGVGNGDANGCGGVPCKIAESFEYIEAGGYNSFGFKADGTLWGWGVNARGELGIGNTSQVRFPTPLSIP